MTTVAKSLTDAVSEYADPIRAAVDENLRDVRRAVAAGRHAVEDRVDSAAVQVRRHPFMSVGIAAGVGVLIGCMIGFMAGRPCAGRSAN